MFVLFCGAKYQYQIVTYLQCEKIAFFSFSLAPREFILKVVRAVESYERDMKTA